MRLRVRVLFLIEGKPFRHGAPVFLGPEPRYENRLIIPDAGFGHLPALVELSADAVTSAFEDDLGSRQIRNGLHDTGEMVASIWPECDLGTVEKLDRPRAPYCLCASRAY